MGTAISPGGQIVWPEIAYKQVGSELVACVVEGGVYREIYPTPERRYQLPARFPDEALRLVMECSKETRRKLERLVVYGACGCCLLRVYKSGGWLLLVVSGDYPVTDGPAGKVLKSATKLGRDAYLRHPPRWLLFPNSGVWTVGCRHEVHLIDRFELHTVACSAYFLGEENPEVSARRTIAASELSPTRSKLAPSLKA